MIRLYRLALASFSVLLLLGAIGANAALASEFEAESYPAHLEGGQVAEEPFVMEAEGGKIECETVTVTGEQTGNSETVEFAPTMAGCKAFGFLGVGIHLNGCKFRARGGGNLGPHKFAGTLDIVCPPNKSIMFTAGTCEFDLPAQNGVTGLGLDIETGLNPAIKFTFGVNLNINVTKDGFGCPFSGTGSRSGKASGAYTVSALDVLKKAIPWILS